MKKLESLGPNIIKEDKLNVDLDVENEPNAQNLSNVSQSVLNDKLSTSPGLNSNE